MGKTTTTNKTEPHCWKVGNDSPFLRTVPRYTLNKGIVTCTFTIVTDRKEEVRSLRFVSRNDSTLSHSNLKGSKYHADVGSDRFL